MLGGFSGNKLAPCRWGWPALCKPWDTEKFRSRSSFIPLIWNIPEARLGNIRATDVSWNWNLLFPAWKCPLFVGFAPKPPSGKAVPAHPAWKQERFGSLAGIPRALCCLRYAGKEYLTHFEHTFGTEIVVQLGPKAALPEFSRFSKDKRLLSEKH